MIHANKVFVIVGSIRPKRIGRLVAQWVAALGRETVAAEVEILDLKDWPLPMDDEPEMPQRGAYAHEHTRAWSRKILEGAAFVFVTPQYNWGYPAPLKNALDHLYSEWKSKPAVIVTYGGHGGGRCGAQLRQVLEGLQMRLVETMPALTLRREMIELNTGEVEADAEFEPYVDTILQAFRELDALIAH